MEENTNGQHLKDTETGFLGVASTVTKKDGTGRGQWLGSCFCLPQVLVPAWSLERGVFPRAE